MDERQRQALSALGAASLEEALARLVEVGVLDDETLGMRRDEQLRRWRGQLTEALGDELEALRLEGRRRRDGAGEQRPEAVDQRFAARGPVVRLDERRAELERARLTPSANPTDAAASLAAAHDALGRALAVNALLSGHGPDQNDEPALIEPGPASMAPPPEGLQLREQRVGHRICLVAEGEIDISTAPALSAALESAAVSGASDLWVDMTGVRFMDSTGISALLALRGELPANRRLALICPPGAVRRTLALAGVEDAFEIFDDRAAAHAAG